MSLSNEAVLAAAGSRKTEGLVERALAIVGGRVLITTYTTENVRHIVKRIEAKVGTVPPNIVVQSWFSFLMAHGVKPYQRLVTGEPFVVQGLNFKGMRNRYASKQESTYYLDSNASIYRNGTSELVVDLNERSGGLVIKRLEGVFSHFFLDEVQDLGGYDLDLLDLLLDSKISVYLVGDLRQTTITTNNGLKNKRYRSMGLLRWLKERKDRCELTIRNESHRCNQVICDFADALFPSLPGTVSLNAGPTGHDGVFEIVREEVPEYVLRYSPVILRHDKNADTAGFSAINIGVSKGGTFDRVLIFPTTTMAKYVRDRDPRKFKSHERLYVAVTRARSSVAFVVPFKAGVLPSGL